MFSTVHPSFLIHNFDLSTDISLKIVKPFLTYEQHREEHTIRMILYLLHWYVNVRKCHHSQNNCSFSYSLPFVCSLPQQSANSYSQAWSNLCLGSIFSYLIILYILQYNFFFFLHKALTQNSLLPANVIDLAITKNHIFSIVSYSLFSSNALLSIFVCHCVMILKK